MLTVFSPFIELYFIWWIQIRQKTYDINTRLEFIVKRRLFPLPPRLFPIGAADFFIHPKKRSPPKRAPY
jgi:hypothetical protein